jgi:NADPH-dependent glutamate synthase beta subunit-like oxidoreductase
MGEFRYERTPITEDTGRSRRGSFGEILHAYTREEAVLEAQRCLQCAMPFCVQACPITQDCRGYIALIAQERFDDAARLTLLDNPLATVLCKCCYHYCEEDCVMGDRGTPIAIRHLKRSALDFGRSDLLYVPSAPRSERVAVIGAGPAGLMAAWELALRGYPVSVYEEQPFLGGQIDTIPRYHLDGTELRTDLARGRDLDITFVTGKLAGRDFTPESLLTEGYRAVYVAIGASDPRALGIPGEELPGVFPALRFLLAVNEGAQGLLGRKGRKVVVVGGGDVALDSARSAIRLTGGSAVTLVYRRRGPEMPAGTEEVAEGTEEGLTFLFERTPVEIVGDAHVTGVVLRKVAPGPPDRSGRSTTVEVPGSDETLPCDTVLVAVGETADLSGLPAELDLRPSRHPWPEGKRPDWMTDVEGVFASGGRSVVYAMAAGTKAAEAIDAYLAAKSGRPAAPRPDPFGGPARPSLPSGYGGPTWTL